MQDLENILTKFNEIVSPKFCNDLAKKCKFVQRSTSQIEGYEFAQAMMIPNAFLEAETLNSLAVRMQSINKKCNLSAPALAQRINSKSAEMFMKKCFAKALKELVKKDLCSLADLQNLSGFKRVLIQDSTQIELHQKLSPVFKGSGGSGAKSALKIDYIFDYLSEEIVNFDFFSGSIPDQQLSNRITSILEKDDLVIRDLGYYAIDRFKEIETIEAYYISRWKVDIEAYESKDAAFPLDLAKFLDKQIYKGVADVQIFIGKERHPTRLVACLLDEVAVDQRRRKANRAAQKRGTQISKKKASLMKYSIFITNVPPELLCSASIMGIYRARWRVELIFKEWKSCLKLHIFKGFNKERFHCFLYGRFIMILLIGSISPLLMRYALERGKELSSYKLLNYLIADHAFPRALLERKIDQFILKMLKDLPKRLCMDKRNRYSLRKNVKTGDGYYKNMEINDLNVRVA